MIPTGQNPPRFSGVSSAPGDSPSPLTQSSKSTRKVSLFESSPIVNDNVCQSKAFDAIRQKTFTNFIGAPSWIPLRPGSIDFVGVVRDNSISLLTVSNIELSSMLPTFRLPRNYKIGARELIMYTIPWFQTKNLFQTVTFHSYDVQLVPTTTLRSFDDASIKPETS